MKIVKRILKWLAFIVLIPVGYFLISLVLNSITKERLVNHAEQSHTIFLSTNGVHLDIIVPKNELDSLFVNALEKAENAKYLSFGWGDENFYINTPTWDDLTFSNAFRAMFLKSSTLMHVSRYNSVRADWVRIEISEAELAELTNYILSSFQLNASGGPIILADQGYSAKDDFYKAYGSYSCLNTCNSWVNTGFKKAGLKACVWTPFDFGLLNKYK